MIVSVSLYLSLSFSVSLVSLYAFVCLPAYLPPNHLYSERILLSSQCSYLSFSASDSLSPSLYPFLSISVSLRLYSCLVFHPHFHSTLYIRVSTCLLVCHYVSFKEPWSAICLSSLSLWVASFFDATEVTQRIILDYPQQPPHQPRMQWRWTEMLCLMSCQKQRHRTSWKGGKDLTPTILLALQTDLAHSVFV